MSTTSRRALRILGVVFAMYAVLVASHEGEFWPFSIYPMFSQAGRTWNRAVVREVPPESPVRWDTLTWATLPGESYGTEHDGNIDAIDLANFVGKTREWTQSRADALRPLLLNPDDERRLVVFRASGRIVGGDSIAVTFVPYVYLDARAAHLNPALAR